MSQFQKQSPRRLRKQPKLFFPNPECFLTFPECFVALRIAQRCRRLRRKYLNDAQTVCVKCVLGQTVLQIDVRPLVIVKREWETQHRKNMSTFQVRVSVERLVLRRILQQQSSTGTSNQFKDWTDTVFAGRDVQILAVCFKLRGATRGCYLQITVDFKNQTTGLRPRTFDNCPDYLIGQTIDTDLTGKGAYALSNTVKVQTGWCDA